MIESDNDANMIPVILSGGSGTRLWPVSRRAHPKPFMKLVDGESLAEKTFRRALGVARSLGADWADVRVGRVEIENVLDRSLMPYVTLANAYRAYVVSWPFAIA